MNVIYKNGNRLADIENRLVAKGEVGWETKDWTLGVSRCKLIYVKWIKNKVLLYGAGNYM